MTDDQRARLHLVQRPHLTHSIIAFPLMTQHHAVQLGTGFAVDSDSASSDELFSKAVTRGFRRDTVALDYVYFQPNLHAAIHVRPEGLKYCNLAWNAAAGTSWEHLLIICGRCTHRITKQ